MGYAELAASAYHRGDGSSRGSVCNTCEAAESSDLVRHGTVMSLQHHHT